jgi:signal transduction histidine kinase
MAIAISCPHCGKPADQQSRFCAHCGIDLALAAVAAEQSAVPPSIPLPEGVQLAPEVLVPRMGEFMVEKGIISQEDVERAVELQETRSAEGRPLLLGQALLELGLVSREALDEIITMRILQLQNGLNSANRQLEQRVRERTQELQQALDRLTELSQLKANFIANISHELRTPLTHIKGYLDMFSNNSLGTLTPQQEEAVAVLLRAENRLEKLIEDLIQFSLASRGELSLHLVDVDLRQLVQSCVHSARGKARSRQLTLDAILPEQSVHVRGDEEKLGWVLAQLIDNAIKFTSKNGRVEVEIQLDQRLACLSVTDTGIGIPAGRLHELFEAFHQLDGSATRRFGGTGLGLAMAQRIIEAHGSQIKVQSVEGRGSRFEFSLSSFASEAAVGDSHPATLTG